MTSDLTDRLKSALGGSHFEALVEGIARGEYSLLLGAGASVGGLSPSGNSLPIGNELAEELVEEFQLPTDAGERLSLTNAYEAAEHRTTKSGSSFSTWLRSRFSGCTPPEWQHILPRFYWHGIWTLNIDDTVEAAYSHSRTLRQSYRIFNWTDAYKKAIAGEVQIVHLHGRAEESDNLIFSVIEYLRAVRTSKTWHRIFGDHFQEQPFIILGTRLANEFDLEGILTQGSASNALYGRPSLIVLREISQLSRERFARFGLIPIQMTADEFFAALENPVRNKEREAAGAIGTDAMGLAAQARTFLDQFGSLRMEKPKAQSPQRDFYAGYDPQWRDILNGLDARLDCVQTVVDDFLEYRTHTEAVQRLELIHGDWGTGKSTALLRIGREMVGRGMDVFIFRGEARLDVAAALWWFQHVPSSLLLFDGVADFADDIASLLKEAKANKTDVMIVGVERESRLRQVYNAIPAEFVSYDGRRHLARLSDAEIARLLKKLEARSRLGLLTPLKPRARWDHFVRFARRHLFTAMASLEGAPGFVDKLRRAVETGRISSNEQEILGLSSLTYEFGYALPLAIASNSTGILAPEIVRAVERGALVEWLTVDRAGLKLRHRYVADLFVRDVLSRSDRYNFSLMLALQLAPLVNPEAIRNRALAYRIAKNVLDADVTKRWMGNDVVQWYSELEDSYAWNARYWEQRALASMGVDRLSEARSFAEKAVSVRRDGFTLTTLANVILHQLIRDLRLGVTNRIDEYWTAVGHLEEARKIGRFESDAPYSVFLTQTLHLCELLRERGPIPSDVLSEVRHWMTELRNSPLWLYPVLVKRFQRAYARILRVIVA